VTSLPRRCAAEAIGTALLLAAVVGSGIMGERLAAGNAAIALLANSLATGFVLYVLIVLFGEISGAHFNPLVTLASRFDRALTTPVAIAYAACQLAGALTGVMLAHAMFGLAFVLPSVRERTGPGQWLAEAVATFGLVLIVQVVSRKGLQAVAAAVAAYITAAYWFTASTSFANPAVTLARALTDTFSGIRSVDVPAFVAAQAVGGCLGYATARWFTPGERRH
jgi:glycerol uptake facilitator-like aquaporin